MLSNKKENSARTQRILHLTLAALTLAALATGAARSVAQTPPIYTLTDLGSLSGCNFYQPKFLNNNGEVFGFLCDNYGGTIQGSFYWKSGVGLKAISSPVAGTVVWVHQINNAGEALLQLSGAPAGLRFYVWTYNSGTPIYTLLSGFSGLPPAPHGINDIGMVVGSSQNPALGGPFGANGVYPSEGILWTRPGPSAGYSVTPLPPLPEDNSSCAYVVNASGVIFGSSWTTSQDLSGNVVNGPARLVRWDWDNATASYVPTPMTDRGMFDAVSFADAGGDVIAYQSGTPSGTYFFLDAVSGSTSLISPGNPSAYTAIKGLNSARQVAGYADMPNGARHAFYWDPSYGANNVLDLGTLGGTTSSVTTSLGGAVLNANGLVTGWANTAPDRKGNQAQHAFVWIPSQSVPPVVSGTMYDLNLLTPSKGVFTSLSAAWTLNDAGQIVGQGPTTVKVGGVLQTHAFLLTPR